MGVPKPWEETKMPIDYSNFFKRPEVEWNLSLDDIATFELSTDFSGQEEVTMTCEITPREENLYLADWYGLCVENDKEVNKMTVHHMDNRGDIAYNLNFMYGRKPVIKKVIFNNPATIVFWYGGDKTVVKCCEDEEWNPRKGLAMAICKKFLGKEYNIFKCLEGASPEVEEKLAIWLCKRILAGHFTETFRKYIDNNPDLKEE